MAKKTAEQKKADCPVSRAEFLEHAQPVEVIINGATQFAAPREFSPQKGQPRGSFGWRSNDKVWITVDGKKVRAQVGLNIIVVDSKEIE